MTSRFDRVNELVEELSAQDLFDSTEDAKDPVVVSIRKQYKEVGKMSDKQKCVLAGWIADYEAEYGR